MKPKIIYISGNEIFDIADIKSAFNEIRDAWGLSADTVLFGVPVDNESSVSMPVNDASTVVKQPVSTIDVTDIPTDTNTSTDVAVTEQEIESETTTEIAEQAVEPVTVPLKRSRGRPKAKVIEPQQEEIQEEVVPEAIVETVTEQPLVQSEPPVVPILSVLASKTDTDIPESNVTDADIAKEEQPMEQDAPVQSEAVTDNTDTPIPEIDDTLPETNAEAVETEKTLEELLESMQPLGEDKKSYADDIVDMDTDLSDTNNSNDINQDDITLENLATEFVASEDKIVATETKAASGGKISKLKNILPFKKASKRNDAGLMGDLFGWAGIAANDEDFSIPGFFTNAASKK